MLKLDAEKTYADKRVISNTWKLYENNEFVYAMRKFPPTGYIRKQKKNRTWPEFDMFFEREEATFKHSNV